MTTVETFDPHSVVTLTAAALAHFRAALADKPGKSVRLSTRESGCTGYAYVLDLVDEAQAGDVLLQPAADMALLIAADAMPLLRGTEIDLVVDGINRVVRFNNPNVVAECGCGESFSVG